MFFLSQENVMLSVLGRRIPTAKEKEEALPNVDRLAITHTEAVQTLGH